MKSPLLNAVHSRFGKLAACLLLALAALPESARSAPSYATATLANNPAAFWQLNETGDPSTGTLPASDSTGNGYNGTYGTSSQNGFNGILGPQPPTYAGFANGQGALQTTAGNVSSPVTLPALNLNTNAVTIAMWINPSAAVGTYTGLLMNRSGGDAAGLGFGGSTNGLAMAALGYTWNTNAGATWGFNSGLFPVAGIWQFAALVIQSNSATIYLYYVDPNTQQTNLLSAVNSMAHTTEAFSTGSTFLGSDASGNAPDSSRVFGGQIAGAAVYKSALTRDQILALFAAGVGVDGFPPSIGAQPQSRYVLSGSSAQLRTTVDGSSPLSYRWQLNGTDVSQLPNSANYTGANSNVLTILSASAAEAGSYQLIVTNLYGTALSSNAVLTIQSPGLVGKWFTNASLADVSGYAQAGIHDGYVIGGSVYEFTNDVPSGKTGQSILLSSASGIAISNSSTLDVSYTNTFDERINNAMTVQVWAKGWPAGWNPFISKNGEAAGWQLRQNGQNNQNPCWTIRGAGGTVTLGAAVYGNPADLAATSLALGGDTNHWHFYVGTFNATTGSRDLYVDGQLVASETGNTVYTMTPTSFLCIGARDNGGATPFGNFFNGQIYDARVYNYARTYADILGDYGVNPPVVAVQPVSVSVFAGEPAQLSATVSGSTPLGYQWRLNGTNVNLLPDSANFTGANSNVLRILNVSASDAGSYSLIVTNPYGTALSSNATVSLSVPKLVGRWFSGSESLADVSGYQPAGIHDGYPVGSGVYTFTDDVPPGLTGRSVSFDNTGGIAIANSSTADGGTYTNTFENSAFSVSFWAKDRGPFGGNWHAWVAKDGYNNNGEYNNIGWSVGIEAWSQNMYFDMEGVDNGGITYTLGDGLWGNQILQCSPNGLPGEDTTWHHYAVTYSAASGVRRTYFDGTLVAQQNGCAQYALATDKHLTIGAQEQTTTGFTGFNRTKMFDVRIFNYALSSNDVVAMLPDPVISVQPPQTITAYAGNVLRISATVLTHSSPVTNQWQHDGTNLVNGAAFGGATVSGANTSTLLIGNVTANAAGVYRLIVSNPNGTVISSNTTVTVANTVPPPAGALVGAWLTGTANLSDSSGYTPAGTHDGHGVAGTGSPSSNYSFTNDVPAGWTGQSLVLPGTTGIAITNSSNLDAGYIDTFDNLTTNMTVAFWAKGWPSGGWNPFVSKFGESGQGWQLRRNGGANPTWTVRGTGTTEDMSANTTMSDDGQWHHYAGTYTFDGTTGSRNLYVDGVLIASQAEVAQYNPAANSYLTIGGRYDGNASTFGNYFAGRIYNTRIYNVALTEAQVNSLAHSVLPVTVPAFSGPPVLNGNKLILSWGTGTLLQATNVTGPWTPTGATSPYTNDITTAPRMFFRLSNP